MCTNRHPKWFMWVISPATLHPTFMVDVLFTEQVIGIGRGTITIIIRDR